MKKYNTYKTIIVSSAFFLLALFLQPIASFADTNQPDIKTTKTPYGQSVIVTFPQNYSGEVESTFDGTSWKTQTKQYTQTDIDAMNKKIQAQQEAFQKMFEAQQQFFQQFWSTWPSPWF
jgi:hypothetical protein